MKSGTSGISATCKTFVHDFSNYGSLHIRGLFLVGENGFNAPAPTTHSEVL